MAEPFYIVSAARTAIGDCGGALKEFAPAELATRVIQEAVKRAGLQPGDVQHVVLGQVIPSEPHDAYIARVAAVNAGIPIEARSEEHTSELQSLMRISYAVFCLKKKTTHHKTSSHTNLAHSQYNILCHTILPYHSIQPPYRTSK